MNSNIKPTLERFIVDEIMLGDRQTTIDPEASLISSGVIDSLALLRLINFVEEQFGVTVGDDEVVPDNFETLSAAEEFVQRKLQ